MLLTFYSCRDAIKRLDDFLDRELTETELFRVERHLKLCHSCSKKFKFEQEIVQGIRKKLAQVTLPADLQNKIAFLLETDGENKDII